MSHFTQALEHARGPGDLFFWFSSQVMGWCKTWMPLYHSAVIDMPTLSQRWVYDLCAEAILIGSIWGNKGRPGVPSELPQWGNTWWVRTLQALPFLELHLTRSKTHSFGLWVWYMTAAGGDQGGVSLRKIKGSWRFQVLFWLLGFGWLTTSFLQRTFWRLFRFWRPKTAMWPCRKSDPGPSQEGASMDFSDRESLSGKRLSFYFMKVFLLGGA